MEEISELRTTHTKTYDLGDGQRRVIGGSKQLHYEDNNGKLKEITADATESDTEIRFEERPQTVRIEKDPFCGVLHIDGDDYEITISVSPFVNEINDTIQNEKHHIDSVSPEKTHSKETITDGFEFTYDVEDKIIDIGSKFTRPEIIPKTFAFHIETSGVTIEESDERHEVYENEKKKSEHPQSIELVDSEDAVLYSMHEPVFIGVDRDWATPLQIEKHTETSITGYFETPPYSWINEVIEQTGSLVMDPSISSDNTLVTDGETQEHTTPSSNIDIYNEEVRWTGSTTTEESTTTHQYRDTPGEMSATAPNTVTETAPLPDPSPLDDNVYLDEAQAGMSVDEDSSSSDAHGKLTLSHPDLGTVVEDDDDLFTYRWTIREYAPPLTEDVLGTDVTFELEATTGTLVTSDVDLDAWYPFGPHTQIETKEETTNSYDTENPQVTINNNDNVTGPSSLSDGETTEWYSTNFVEGTVSFYHEINSSQEAYFEYQYDYSYLPPDPPSNVTVTGPES